MGSFVLGDAMRIAFGPRTSPEGRSPHFDPGSAMTRAATSLFQMNSTMIAPMVAVMNPAP
jgi:hypothetical protein